MKSLSIFPFLIFACSYVRNGAENTTTASEPVGKSPTVSGQWDRKPISVRIPSRYLDLGKLTFARIASQASEDDPPAPAFEVKLKIEGKDLLLNDSQPPHNEIARWEITGKEMDGILVAPPHALSERRYFHDVRSATKGLWFHETVQTQTPSTLPPLQTGPEKTWTIYLLTTAGMPEFTPQSPVKEIGYLVNYRDLNQAGIYDGHEPFNPNKLFITKWYNRRTIEWVISRSLPREFIPFINEGILAWNEVLPRGLKFSTRLANPGEDLDGPFTNAVVHQPSMTSGHAAASYTFYPYSGEIFRATLVIGKLPDEAVSHGPKLRASVSHEAGHTLGLRHNYKGSLYDGDLATYPTGSSIMEYSDQALDNQRRIGPYDRDAIRWAYADNSFTTAYPFCTDEGEGIDPLCQAYDPTSSNPFEILSGRVRSLIDRQIDQSDDIASFTQGKSPFDRMGFYIRLPGTPFYNASTNSVINALFERFLESASKSPAPIGAQTAARHLQRIVDGAALIGISESQLKTALPAFAAFEAWKAAHTPR